MVLSKIPNIVSQMIDLGRAEGKPCQSESNMLETPVFKHFGALCAHSI